MFYLKLLFSKRFACRKKKEKEKDVESGAAERHALEKIGTY